MRDLQKIPQPRHIKKIMYSPSRLTTSGADQECNRVIACRNLHVYELHSDHKRSRAVRRDPHHMRDAASQHHRDFTGDGESKFLLVVNRVADWRLHEEAT